MMKFKIVCNECFQSVETVLECETYQELADAIRMTRNAIYDGCSDAKSSSQKKRQPEPKSDVLATEKQLALIRKKLSYEDQLEYDLDTMTTTEASNLIKSLIEAGY